MGMVANVRDLVERDVGAIRAEHRQAEARMKDRFVAAMEQSQALKAWREQQNTRILEMQARPLFPSPFLCSARAAPGDASGLMTCSAI